MAARKKKSKRRTTLSRRHAVRAQLTVHELTKAGTSLFLEISALGEKIGELEIGRGSLYWKGGKRHTRKRLPWSRFAELMDKLAYAED
ncbi:MAG: hypothetical protein ABI681_06470 [Gemmatimonadales bacterium]